MTTKIVDVTKQQKGKELPNTFKVIHVEYVNPDTGKTYGDDFTIKRLNIGDIRKVAIRRAELNGALPEDSLDVNVKYMNAMIAHLERAIVKSPEWWTPEEFYDGSILQEVYEEVMSFEESFREAARKRTSGATRDSEKSFSIDMGDASTLVEQKVQTPSELEGI